MTLALTRQLAFATLALGALTAVSATPARAQAFPSGSYQASCTQVHWAGTTLVAECQRRDGRMTGTGLANALKCGGDISNNNGQLQCNSAGAAQVPRGPAPAAPGYGQTPGYGGSPGYGQTPGYGGAPGYGQAPTGYDDRRERCKQLWHREGELRERLQSAPWGEERERLEYRLHETHDDRERLDCGR